MFEKLENSWKLAKECWRILMLDKEMLAFPALSTVTTILVMAFIGYPLWAAGFFDYAPATNAEEVKAFHLSILIKYAVLTIVPSYIIYLILTFFNAGLVTCAFIRLCGDDPILADGFNIAWKRLPQIFTWSLLGATVGLLLRMVKGNNSTLRSLFSGVLGLGWRVASFFAVPVIVAEEKGAIDALKRSGQLVKKNWGEALTLEVGLSVLAYPVMLPVMAMIGMSSYVWAVSPMLGGSLLIIAGVYTFVASLVFSTLDAIAKAALYMFASGDQMPENFNNEILQTMFKRENATSPSFA